MSLHPASSCRIGARRLFNFGLMSSVLGTITALSPPAAIAASSTYLSGQVVDAAGKPIAHATVNIDGQNIVLKEFADRDGRFSFPSLGIGTYTVRAANGQQHAEQSVVLSNAGTDIVLRISELAEIGVIRVNAPSQSRRSGTDVAIDAHQLSRLPTGNSLPDILTQLPAAARGSNGQVHINGDHNGLNYYVDGVQLPTSLNRVLGTEIDPQNIGFIDAIEGAYPAQYGDRFAAVLDIGTKVRSGPAGADASIEAGSYGSLDTDIGYHSPLPKGGAVSIATHFAQTNRGIDPPVQQFVNDREGDDSQFIRLTLPGHGLDTYNLDVLHSQQTFQIPPDTANGVPATTDDAEQQNDTFASLQYRHAIKSHGSFSFGPSVKVSRILDTGDPTNDLAPSLAPLAQQAVLASPVLPPHATACTDFGDCRYFSAAADRLARDYRLNADYDLRSDHHDIKAGALYGTTLVDKSYAITLQPYSKLDPTGDYAVADTSPNVAHQQEAYVQDSWKLGAKYIADYGLRADAFQIFSTDFRQGFSQVSPRLKLTRIVSAKSSIYGYYGRLFVPFSFENVSPTTAAELYLPGAQTSNGFDLRPQRDSLYEAGGHVGLGNGTLGVRLSHKVSTDYLDDTQVGATNLHQDINFPRGRVDQETGYYQLPTTREGRIYLSVTHSIAVNSLNCETQLLQNCAASGPPGGDFVQSDHDQHWDVSGGIISNDKRNGWVALNGEYGSGLSIGDPTICPSDNAVNCKVPPHLIFNAEKGITIAPATTLALSMQNILNDHYAFTVDSALQGTHYASPRTISVLLRYKQL